ELYGTMVLETIRTVLDKNHSLKDICILTRKKKQGVFLAEFLMRSGVPIISSESLLLNSSPKVRFLVQLLRLSLQPHNKEISYEILYFLAEKNEGAHEFIKKNLGQAGRLLRTGHDFYRSEEHTSELQSREKLVCRLLL